MHKTSFCVIIAQIGISLEPLAALERHLELRPALGRRQRRHVLLVAAQLVGGLPRRAQPLNELLPLARRAHLQREQLHLEAHIAGVCTVGIACIFAVTGVIWLDIREPNQLFALRMFI